MTSTQIRDLLKEMLTETRERAGAASVIGIVTTAGPKSVAVLFTDGTQATITVSAHPAPQGGEES